MKKFGKDVIEGLLKKYPELQKQAMTGAERMKASRERLTQQERINDWELCINFLMASS